MLRVCLPDLEYARALDQRRLQRIRVHAQHSASPALRSTISALQKPFALLLFGGPTRI
jgi:hypothetical protein